MKKLIMAVITTFSVIFAAYSYNPPVGGDYFYDFSSPKLLSGTLSVAGGPVFTISPEAVILNPAATATAQRTDLTLGYTALISANSFSQNRYGNVIQTSILIPSKLYIFTGIVNFTSVNFLEMSLGNSLNLRANVSKQITDKFDIGLALTGGIYWKDTSFDWSIAGNAGVLFKPGDLGFIKDFRIGVSVSNLGKMYTDIGINNPTILDSGFSYSGFPSFCYVRAGIAGNFVSTEKVKLGFALDFGTPCFQNFLAEYGMQLAIMDTVFVNFKEQFNLAEAINSKANYLPSIGISFKFTLDINNVKYLEENDWSQSEMKASVAYKNLYNTVHVASVDVDLTLGLKDEAPPEISIWDDDEEE